MDIFSQPPKSFKLDRDSPFAADLKSAISVQLPLLLGPLFNDDILTEYITVLVCNGKTQNQAREDLDAFLGDRSEAFVSWLWDLLLKSEQQCRVATALKDKGDITSSPEDGERKRNALGVKSEKAGDAATITKMHDHQTTRNNLIPQVLTSSPKRDLSRATSPVPNCSHASQVSGSLYCDKGTVSVWDRLSRPNNCALIEPHVDNVRKYREVQNEICSPLLSKSSRSRMRSEEVIHQCNRYQGRSSRHYPTSNFDNISSGNHFVNDMQRKRNFVQISQSDSRSGGRRSGDNYYNNQCRADKRSKFAAKTPIDLLSTVEDVKLRLRQMEREISLLRSRNVEGKNRKNNSSTSFGKSSSSGGKLTAEDHDSRTVLVSNVHYAARRDALFVYFARCGRVINVVLLSDLSCFAPDSFVRSAYVTFASSESVEKAVSLSGTIFYSRTLTVLKCNDEKNVLGSPAVSYSGRSVEQSGSYGGKRECSPCTPLASEQLTDSGPEQQPSSSKKDSDQLPCSVSPAKAKVFGDEQSSSFSPVVKELQVQVEPLEDNAESAATVDNTVCICIVEEANVEQPGLVSVVEEGSGNSDIKVTDVSVDEETENVTGCVACLPESVKKDDVSVLPSIDSTA